MQLILTNNTPKTDLQTTTVINDISLLDMMIEDSECNNIVVDSFLSNFTIEEIPEVLQRILYKLRINGTIIVTDVEIEVMANSLLLSDIDLYDFIRVIFSNEKTKSLLTIELVKSYFNDFKIEISKAYIENNFFVVEGKRVING